MAGVRLLLMLVAAAHAGFHGAAGAAKCRKGRKASIACFFSGGSAGLAKHAEAFAEEGFETCVRPCPARRPPARFRARAARGLELSANRLQDQPYRLARSPLAACAAPATWWTTS